LKTAEKFDAEILKAKNKISELQLRVRELEKQKAEAIDSEILGIVKSGNLSRDELLELITSFKKDAKNVIKNDKEEEN